MIKSTRTVISGATIRYYLQDKSEELKLLATKCRGMSRK